LTIRRNITIPNGDQLSKSETEEYLRNHFFDSKLFASKDDIIIDHASRTVGNADGFRLLTELDSSRAQVADMKGKILRLEKTIREQEDVIEEQKRRYNTLLKGAAFATS
jgi:hypothetical protein